MKKILPFTLLFALLIPSTVCRAQAAYNNPVIGQSAPDPTVIQTSNGYYLYATEDTRNVPIFHSYDLIHWVFKGTAFTDATRPKFVSGGGIWAPDINYINGKYVMYYSMSVWGGETTCGIGIATADKPEGPFTDRGKLFISSEIGVQNSIDPCFFEDGGKKYLFWGSFRGIYAIELSADGFSLKGTKQQIAGTAFEATCIHKRGSYFYLFASWGSCCEGLNSTYKTVVGRATSLLGPYYNKAGTNMMSNGLTDVIVGNASFKGVGHNARIVQDRVGNDWILYHGFATSAPNQRRVFLDRVTWDANNWPVVSGGEPSSKANAPEPLASTPLADGTYYIQHKSSGKNVEVPGGNNSDGAKIRLWTANTATCQQWKFTRQSDGAFKLINVQSGKALDLPSGTSDNVQLQQYTDNGQTPQRWYVYDMGGGYVKIKNRASGKPMEIASNGNTDGAVVRQWDNNDSDAQRFKLIPVTAALTLNLSSSSSTNTTIGNAQDVSTGTVYLWVKDDTGKDVSRQDCNLTSSYTTVAEISIYGTITLKAPGTTTINAVRKADNVAGSLVVTVTGTVPTVLRLVIGTESTPPYGTLLGNPASTTFGKDVYLGIDGNNNAANPTWLSRAESTLTSSNTGVATINTSGTITPVNNGTTTIKAVNGGRSGTIDLTVTGTPVVPVAVTGVSVNPSTLSLEKGGTSTLIATVNPSNATNKNVTWSSSATGIATVDGSGKVTAIAKGSATITVASVENSALKANCALTVTDTQQPPLTADGRLKLKIVARKAADNPPAAAVTDPPLSVLTPNTAASTTGAGVLFINEASTDAPITRITKPGVSTPEPATYTSYEVYPAGKATVSDFGGITTFDDCTLTIKATNDGRSGLITIKVGNGGEVGINAVNIDEINIFSTDTGIAVQFKGEALIELYTVNGILIDKTQVSQFYSRDLAKGVYILRVNGKTVKFVR